MKLTKSIQSGLNGRPTFPLSFRLHRMLWMLVWTLLASWTPPQFRGWRRFLLRSFGAEIHSTAGIRGSAKIWYPPNLKLGAGSSLGPRVNCYNVDMIEIGERVVISQDTFLCTASHNFKTKEFLLITRPITIENDVWIAAEAFVGPGVIIHNGAILGARGAAFQNVEAWKVYRGNPARVVSERALTKEKF